MPQSTLKGNIAGKAINEARNDLSLSQGDLIIILKKKHSIILTQTMLSRIENGTRTIRDIELVAFSKALKLSPNQLLDWKE